jgi:chromosome partitioning protein
VYNMKIIAALNKKGGAGKTTTLIGLAYALRGSECRVGVIDCDPNGSASRWLADADMDTVPCHHSDLQPLLDQISGDYDMLLIDSPPNDIAAIAAIARVSDLAVIPLAPTGIETDQLADTVDLIPADTAWVVVPVRVRLSTSAGREIRRLCDDNAIPTTRTIVPLSEAVARSFGAAPPRLPFAPLAAEIRLTLEGAAA